MITKFKILIGILAVGIVLIGGWFIWNNKQIDVFTLSKSNKSISNQVEQIQKQIEEKIISSSPILRWPVNRTRTTDNIITFGWHNIGGVEKYLLQIDNTSDFSSPEIEKYVGYSQFKLESPLSDNAYYWRVKAIYETGKQSEWSNTSKITIFSVSEDSERKGLQCIPEGKTGCRYKNDKCCDGLTPISMSRVCNTPGDEMGCNKNGCFPPPPCDCFICANCGNGVCGLGENRCNCSKDCK